jgi:hypothetical protein
VENPYAYVKDTTVHADAKVEAVLVAEAGSGAEKEAEADSGHVRMQLDWYVSAQQLRIPEMWETI